MLSTVLGVAISLLIRVENTNQYSRTDKFYYICQAAEVDQSILEGIMEVESHGDINLVGDKHLSTEHTDYFN